MTSYGRPFLTSSEQIRSIVQPTTVSSMPPINYRSTALVARPRTASGFVDYQPLLRPSAVARASTGRSHSSNTYQNRNLSNFQQPRSSNTRVVSAGPAGRMRHRPMESMVLKRAPYGQRPIADPLLSTSSSLPHYSSLYDPHLQRYFTNKFNLNGRTRGLRQKVDTMYVVTVKMGEQKNAGTIANLFLRMNGKSERVNKQKLTKKSGIVDTEEYGNRYEFKVGSENVFKIKGPQIKHMHSIVIESDGLLPEESCFVDEISVEDLRTKKTWTFLCENWLSLYETDCQLSRELFADPQTEKYQATDYEITTVTGSKFGAGTDANVFVTLYGDQGFSPRLNLYTPGDKKAPFERGKTDRFVIHTKDVGKMKKLRIEHDNTGGNSGWYLDHVLVKNTRTNKQWFFPCQRWLAKDEDDGRICRDLLSKGHSADDSKMYTIHVTTGNKSGAGTNANVFATIFGDKGDSGELALKGKGNLFEKGDTNDFPFELPDLGKLSKLRIRHDDSGLNSGWFLEKVTVTFGSDTYEFPCKRWLAKDEDDGKISRDLIATNAKGLLHLFEITVITGDVRNSGTDAKVFLDMTSKNESSGKMWLEGGEFERKSIDTFKLDIATNLGPLDTVTVGHDNSGRGPGWFLDKIVVFNPKIGLEQHFPCNKWLATDEDDGLIERTLNEDKSLRKKRDKETIWNVEVTTSDASGAGTNANVHMTLYGSEGHSEQIALENESDKFERGQVDQFTIQTPHIGLPTKMRVGHDNSGSAAGWHLHKVEVTNRDTNDKYVFNCDRWLATDEDDGEIIRELPAEGKGIKKPLTVRHYKLAVKTGGKFGAGTNADVVANIFGKNGDTGERSLKKSEHTNKFERNQTDTFTIEAVDLGDIEKLKIGHNGKGAGDGWFLDGVALTCAEDSKLNASFPCGRWLATDEDDGLLVRELFAAKSGKHGHDEQQHQDLLKTTTYKVTVKTGDVRNAGTDADVFLVIFGEKDDSGKIPLARAENNKNPFERGKADLFTIETEDLAKIKKILIGHNGKGVGSGWYLEDIEIAVPSRGETFRFVAQRWLDENEADKQLQVELFPLETEKRDRTIPYELTVTTGDVRSAGTDANVFIQIYGENGKTSEFQLNDKSNNFERANVDTFKVDGHDVGRIQKIRIGHDGKGAGSGWFLDRVKIRKQPSKIEKRRDTLKKQEKVKSNGRLHRQSSSRLSSRRGSSDRQSFSDSRSSSTDTSSSQTGDTLRKSSRNGMDSCKHPKGRPKSASSKGHKLSRNARGSLTDSDHLESDGSLSRRTKSKTRKQLDDKKKSRRPESRSSTTGNRSGRRERSTDSDTDTESDISQSTESDSDGNKRDKKHNGKNGNGDKRPNSSLSRDRRQSTRYRIDSLSEDSQSSGADSHKTYTRQKPSLSNGRTSKNAKSKEQHKLSDSHKSTPRLAKSDRKLSQRKRAVLDADGFEVYYFVCNRWFSTSEDDGQIIRELVPTDEQGKPLKDNAIQEKQYEMHVFTGNVSGAGTDANVFINLYGEHGDTGDRQLKESSSRNKFESGQEDVFTLGAIDLGHLKKLKIWHDNSGMSAAWFLDRVEVIDKDKKIIFPCEQWFSTKEGDGRICRELIPFDEKMVHGKSSTSLKEQFGLEMKAQTTTFDVFVTTGDKRGAGTDANVYLVLYGDKDDTGKIQLKTSLTNSNKFERKQTDPFTVETVDIGNDLKKILIGHDNAGGFADWYLEKVDIDCPSLGKKWHFPCSKWFGKDADDGKLERELYPAELATEKYETCVPYEFTVHTSDIKGAGTDSDVFVALFGPDGKATRQLSLCPTKRERKEHFNRGAIDKFIVELEDLDEIVKLRIGHDGNSWGSGWHCDQVVVKKLLNSKGESQAAVYTFPCNRWLAKDEDDHSIVRDLIPSAAVVESQKADGSVKTKELSRSASVKMKHYKVHVHTGDVWRAGTDANVYMTIYGTLGDSGKRQLKDSETHSNKFERNNTDVFDFEVADLGQVFKIDIGHDDSSMMGSNWFLNKVDVIDPDDKKTFEFHCERWLAKNKDDGLIERTLFSKDYDPSSGLDSKSTRTSKSAASDRTALTKSSGTARIEDSDRNHRSKIIPYTIKLTVGDQKDAGTEAPVWLKLIGGKQKEASGRIVLTSRSGHLRSSATETFSLDAPNVGKLHSIEIGIDSKAANDALFIKDLQITLPTKGLEWLFHLDQWFGRDKGDGQTKRTFRAEGDNVVEQTFKHHTPYEVYFETADESNAGTDCHVSVQLFGTDGASNEVTVEKLSDRFERGQTSVVKIELEDAGEPRKLRIRLVAPQSKPSRPKWLLQSVEMINMFTDKTFVFPCKQWFGLKKDDDCEPSRDLIASTAKGDAVIGTTNYIMHVFTSDAMGAGTDANVCCELYDENGHNSGELKLKQAENATNKFESGHEDVFQFPGLPQLGPLVKLRVWHDNSGLGAAWHLDKIEVHDITNKKTYIFPCGQWLSKDEQLSRELFCTHQPAENKKDKRKADHDEAYEIIIKTGDKRDAGTVHDGTLVLRGEKNDSERFWLYNSPRNKIMRRGQTDSMKLKSTHPSVGKIHSILLGHFPQEDIPVSKHPENERENFWYCEEITVIDLQDGKKYKFICNDWIPLSSQQKDAIEIDCADSQKNGTNNPKAADLTPTTYELIVVTGTERGAGTDANVSVTLFGANGNSGKQRLTGSKFSNLFENGQRDNFTIECADLGKLSKLAIEHDNSGFGAGWYLDKVEVKNMKSGQTIVFPCNQWLDKSKGDGAIARDLLPSKAS